jgi:hypothetical protein
MGFFPQVLIEAMVSRDGRGYIAIDDIMLLNYPCCKWFSPSALHKHQLNKVPTQERLVHCYYVLKNTQSCLRATGATSEAEAY